MICAYCGSTSTKEQEISIFRGSVGTEVTPTGFGNSDYHLSRYKENANG